MNKHFLKTFATVGFFMLMAVAAHAQTPRVQTASVPFDFNVGGRTLPAGEYRVERINPQSYPAAVVLRSKDGRLSLTLLTRNTESNGTEGDARLVFNRYGERYFLAQVWHAADPTGLQLPTSTGERRLRRGLRIGAAPAQRSVALVSRRDH